MQNASEHPDHEVRTVDLQCDTYFVKPAGLSDLQSIVQEMRGF